MDPFLGEIRLLPYTFAPYQWLACNGQTLAVSQYSALFSLLGTTYGGNGTSTFNLPNLNGRGAVGAGQGPGLSNYSLGEELGETQVTLLAQQNGPHTHGLQKRSPAAPSTTTLTNTPGSSNALSRAGVFVSGVAKNNLLFGATSDGTTLAPSAIGPSPAGGTQPHANEQPYLVLQYCIAMSGVYPQFD